MGKESRNIELQYQKQKELAEFEHGWQEQQAQAEHQWQQDEWTRQFNMENEYNSPSAQAARMREAGFNPSALAGESAMTQVSAAASPATPAAQGRTPFSYQAPQGMSSTSQLFEALASLNNSLSKAVGTNLDVERQQKMLGVMFDNAFADFQGKQFANAYKQVELGLFKKYGDTKQSYEMLDTLNHAILLGIQGESEKAKQKMTSALEELYKSQDQRIKAELPYYAPYLIAMTNFLGSGINLNMAKASEAYASAEEHRAGADYKVALTSTENALREGKGTLQQLTIDMARITKSVDASNARTFLATEGDRLRATIAMYEREGFITSEAKARADKAIKENNWFEVSKIMDLTTQAIGSYTGYFNAGTQRLNALSEQERNRIRNEFNRLYSSEERFTENGSSMYIMRGVAP